MEAYRGSANAAAEEAMTLSQALRRSAIIAFDDGNDWINIGSDAEWRAIAAFCYQTAGSVLTLADMWPDDRCLMLLLLAEIAEDGGM